MKKRVYAKGPPFVRFWARVDKNGPNGCWLWQGAIAKDGYGKWTIQTGTTQNRFGTVSMAAHKYAWILYKVNPPSKGFDIDHVCKVRNCVNPGHMRILSHRENIRNGSNKKEFCKLGHALSGENYYAYHVGGKIRYRCSLCIKARKSPRRCARRGGGGQIKPLGGPKICPCMGKLKHRIA